MTFPNCDPHSANGDINRDAWASMKNALLHPHREAVRNEARSESRREEKESKKRCLEDAKPDGFFLPTIPANNIHNGKKRAAKAKSPLPADAEMPVDEFISQTTLTE
ncbi:hypothetical protein J132_07618 [Termitomyces sp. J132]|nr:hypothetical protein H2248_008883 [Termitomyces sp. 'cryptogamus']KNZ74176.1 hypothetical protein J132_07618 [Termitomyces sp. J132]